MTYPSSPVNDQVFERYGRSYIYSTTTGAWGSVDVVIPTVEGSVGVEVYAELASLPTTDNSEGDQAFVSENGSLYVWDGTQWSILNAPAFSGVGIDSPTGAATLPAGTTAQRPVSPVVGMVRFNTDLNYLEEYRSGQWLAVSDVVSADGGTIAVAGGYKYHTFTSSGTFSVRSGSTVVEYLIVAGGGSHRAGGAVTGSGGGGAGGVVDSSITATAQTYPIVIGAGGAGASGAGNGSNGDNSTAFGQTAIGGGRGASYNGWAAASGGSGGGGGYAPTAGAAGTLGQGNAGGTGINGTTRVGGGGGGAGGAGGDGSGSGSSGVAGNGGVGINWKSLGTYYAGGGAGGAAPWTEGGKTAGTGGLGGGGNGARASSQVYLAGDAGAANTGGGVGGASVNGGSQDNQAAANGGSGIVIIRYAI